MTNLQCPFCDKTFRTVTTLQDHLYRKEMSKNASEICGKLAKLICSMDILDEYDTLKELHRK
jgi:hypothetical protein